MRFETYVVAELLQRLEEQGLTYRRHVAEVAAALSKDRYLTAREASKELTRALDALVGTTETLRHHVEASDAFGEIGESIGELALRAREMVVLAQLSRLRDSLADLDVQTRTRKWFVGRFQSIEHVESFFHNELDRINAIWLPYRVAQRQSAGMTDPDRLTLYRTAVRVAQRALRELVEVPDLALLLDYGIAATELCEIHLACKQIVAALGVHIDIEPPSQHVFVRARARPARQLNIVDEKS